MLKIIFYLCIFSVLQPVYDTDEEEQNEIKKEIEQLHQWKKTGQVTKNHNSDELNFFTYYFHHFEKSRKILFEIKKMYMPFIFFRGRKHQSMFTRQQMKSRKVEKQNHLHLYCLIVTLKYVVHCSLCKKFNFSVQLF